MKGEIKKIVSKILPEFSSVLLTGYYVALSLSLILFIILALGVIK